ncbi:threonine synthase [Portibacter lacus]|uniref:Threonine synthase n=1 Tax=Portibacter lacus TaxID=1099794 RepID=A0AA37WEL8_9BACT|nr:threonine synthase [Portibacter lacus]GLR18911.1 threonine synthase [Portibacter lacus]
MQLYSTKNPDLRVDFGQAILNALPKDNGLYMPTEIPKLGDDFIKNIRKMSFQEMSYEIAKTIIGDSIPADILKEIVYDAINFPAEVVHIHDNIYSLELFHGPTLAFKDFGARFMSRVMKYFKKKGKKLYILVATSGDTGGAVASGFYKVDGIEIVILFPKGKVSPLQQKQLTTLGENITAVEIDGTFDDCQAIVKKAFLDEEMSENYDLSSANSINISRLIPQSFYYFNALKQVDYNENVSFVVPSGNFGNITAGILGQKMGLPVKHFIAATNANDVVPEYIATGEYRPRPATATISNAMDVGDPSNFPRLSDLYGSTWNTIKDKLKGYAYSDEQTKETILEVYKDYGYLLDPHGAIGYLAAMEYKYETGYEEPIIFLETAHPSKFKETVEETLNQEIEIPERLSILSEKQEHFYPLPNKYEKFKKWFKSTFEETEN